MSDETVVKIIADLGIIEWDPWKQIDTDDYFLRRYHYSLQMITDERVRESPRFEWYHKLMRGMYDEWKQNRLEIDRQSNQ